MRQKCKGREKYDVAIQSIVCGAGVGGKFTKHRKERSMKRTVTTALDYQRGETQ